MNSISGAGAVLGQAQEALRTAAGALRATADKDVNSGKELARAVFSAGFQIAGLNSIIGRIEEAGNEVHALAGKLEAIAKAIDDVK